MDQLTQDLPFASSLMHGYSNRREGVDWPLLALIGALHIGALYLLAHALVPDIASSVERDVIAAFDVGAAEPAPVPDPAPASAPAASPDPAVEEVTQADAVQEVVVAPVPAPAAGAGDTGESTSASGQGLGTGNGNSGMGQGGIAVTRPVHISGTIDNASDYPTPRGGRDARRGTEVIVRVNIGIDGRARDCAIYHASPDPQTDAITCQLVEQRLGFRPAYDALGNPVVAPFYWRQVWF